MHIWLHKNLKSKFDTLFNTFVDSCVQDLREAASCAPGRAEHGSMAHTKAGMKSKQIMDWVVSDQGMRLVHDRLCVNVRAVNREAPDYIVAVQLLQLRGQLRLLPTYTCYSLVLL